MRGIEAVRQQRHSRGLVVRARFTKASPAAESVLEAHATDAGRPTPVQHDHIRMMTTGMKRPGRSHGTVSHGFGSSGRSTARSQNLLPHVTYFMPFSRVPYRSPSGPSGNGCLNLSPWTSTGCSSSNTRPMTETRDRCGSLVADAEGSRPPAMLSRAALSVGQRTQSPRKQTTFSC